MHTLIHIYRLLVLTGILLSTFLSHVAKADQIVTLTGDDGRTIYVNTSEVASSVALGRRGIRPNTSAVSTLPPAEIDKLVVDTAKRYKVDPDLVRAVIHVESGFDPKAVSNKGAMGLMQLIPATAQRFGVDNPFDPKQNIDGGVNYLKHLLDMFGGDLNLSLAAYNAGEHAVQRSGGIPAIPETQSYVRKVTSIYQTGDSPAPKSMVLKVTPLEPPTTPITRSVDAYGVVHFSNVD